MPVTARQQNCSGSTPDSGDSVRLQNLTDPTTIPIEHLVNHHRLAPPQLYHSRTSRSPSRREATSVEMPRGPERLLESYQLSANSYQLTANSYQQASIGILAPTRGCLHCFGLMLVSVQGVSH
jgi:hypothetical protein